MIPAREALDRLRAGNRRFVAHQTWPASLASRSRLAGQTGEQQPFAIVLGCSDSRVPAELVFDQGFGDLFVIRVAGNIVAPSQIGSVEFAASRFGTRLVVVLGHSQCGAVIAALEVAMGRATSESRHLRSIVNRVRPSVEALLAANRERSFDDLLDEAVRAHVRAAANHLRHGSPLLEQLIAESGFLVVGAEYSLATGAVDFFDGVPGE